MITQAWAEAVLGILYSVIDCDGNARLTYYTSVPPLGEDHLSLLTLKLHYNIWSRWRSSRTKHRFHDVTVNEGFLQLMARWSDPCSPFLELNMHEVAHWGAIKHTEGIRRKVNDIKEGNLRFQVQRGEKQTFLFFLIWSSIQETFKINFD